MHSTANTFHCFPALAAKASRRVDAQGFYSAGSMRVFSYLSSCVGAAREDVTSLSAARA
jgi:hypothetical protein